MILWKQRGFICAIISIMLVSLLLAACAAPRGDAEKRYELNSFVYCFAPNCTVDVNIEVEVSADVKKRQAADAKADISPTVDIAP